MTHANAPLSAEGRRRFIDPSSDTNRKPRKITARRPALPDERSATAVAFLRWARAWFAAYGITCTERVVTDNDACYRAGTFARPMLGARHQRIMPYTPRHNGKVERYNRIIAEKFLHARSWLSENQRRDALGVWNIHYNYHRPHGAAGGKPPAQLLRAGVTNVLASYICHYLTSERPLTPTHSSASASIGL